MNNATPRTPAELIRAIAKHKNVVLNQVEMDFALKMLSQMTLHTATAIIEVIVERRAIGVTQ